MLSDLDDRERRRKWLLNDLWLEDPYRQAHSFADKMPGPGLPFYVVLATDFFGKMHRSPPFKHHERAVNLVRHMPLTGHLTPWAIVKVVLKEPKRLECRQKARGHCVVTCGPCEGGVPVGGP